METGKIENTVDHTLSFRGEISLDSFAPILNDIRNQADPGEAFEKLFSKWFLENDPYWKTQVKQVWLWDDWPDRWGRDKGIDLIFKHKNGETWAVQAKCFGLRFISVS